MPNAADGPAADRPEGPDPFAALKTIMAFDHIRLRVPAIWPCAWDEKAGQWCCCEDLEDPAADTGTLWIDVNVLELGPDIRSGRPSGDRAIARMAEKIATEKAGTGRPGASGPELRDTRWGKAVCYSHPFETEKGRFVEHRWHCLSLVVNDLVVTHYSLVLTAETAGRPAWRRLVDTMDREIRAADFGPEAGA